MNVNVQNNSDNSRYPFDRVQTWIWWDYPNSHTLNWKQVDDSMRLENFSYLKQPWQEGNRPVQFYLHVPYCQSFCYYCGYTRENFPKQTKSAFDEYVDGLISELRWYLSQPYVQTAPLTAITIGGGSPSTLPPESLDRLFKFIADNVPNYENLEKTFTGEPRTLKRLETLQLLIDYKWNRVTFGVESLNEKLRSQVGRMATEADVDDVHDGLAKVGYQGDVNFDLMYNLPGENFTVFEEELDKVITKYGPTSLDGYPLVYTPYEALWKLIEKGRKSQPATARDLVRMLEHFYDYLTDKGYYNTLSLTYAKYSHPTQFYRGVYDEQDVIPVGISARGNFAGMSAKNPTDLGVWQDRVASNGVSTSNMQKLPPDLTFTRKMVMFPQMKSVPKAELQKFSDVPTYAQQMERLQSHIDRGLVEETDETYELTRLGVVWFKNLQADYVADTLTDEGKDIMLVTSYAERHFDVETRIPHPEKAFDYSTHPERETESDKLKVYL